MLILRPHFFGINLEYECPGDGTCSNQGICDDTTGICICEAGFEGLMCQGKGWFLSHNCHIHSKLTLFTVISYQKISIKLFLQIHFSVAASFCNFLDSQCFKILFQMK